MEDSVKNNNPVVEVGGQRDGTLDSISAEKRGDRLLEMLDAPRCVCDIQRREIHIYILNRFVYFETRVDKSIDGWISVGKRRKRRWARTFVYRGESSKSTSYTIPIL